MDKNSFYKPSGNIKDTNRTYVPDLYRQVAAEMQEEESVGMMKKSLSTHVVRLQNRPIVGVLYSISASPEGELFPIYVGRNTIGSDLSCDICLRETSVSAQHGMLLARRQMDDDGREYFNVILSDSNSCYGTCLNGEKVVFEKVVCADGDVISIGQNYVLILSLFNALDKLVVSGGFDRMPMPSSNEDATFSRNDSENVNDCVTAGTAGDHSTNATQDINEEASMDFYRPTKQKKQDHYNNQTIIL